jgi:hypothetical protein
VPEYWSHVNRINRINIIFTKLQGNDYDNTRHTLSYNSLSCLVELVSRVITATAPLHICRDGRHIKSYSYH